MINTSFTGRYSVTTNYLSGDYVLYGGKLYQAITNNTATSPANVSVWTLISPSFSWLGNWSIDTTYSIGQSVSYGNTKYLCLVNSNVGNQPDISPNQWRIFNNNYNAVVTNQPGDIQYEGITKPIRLPVGNTTQVLTVSNLGFPVWANTFSVNATANVYYVATNGIDDTNSGTSINNPWKTLQYATQRVSNNSTIYVKSGTYNETLPIVVPQGVSIVGDTIRTTIIQPISGNTGTMFLMSDSSFVTQLTVKGMTGFSSTNNSINGATIAGVVFALNPASPVINKSPYIKDVTTILSGGIGALIDGSVHTTGYKSMLVDSVTFINDNGVGVLVNNGGRLEAVSTFTYYCYFGFAANSGATIRTMGCNDAYGTYGVSADGANTLVRLTGHQFMSIGTGGTANTNYPGIPLLPVNSANQVISSNGASVYYVSTDENSNLSIGPYFKITSSNGTITSANSITSNSLTTNILSAGAASSNNLVINLNSNYLNGNTDTYFINLMQQNALQAQSNAYNKALFVEYINVDVSNF
jgi:hypothetical protein